MKTFMYTLRRLVIFVSGICIIAFGAFIAGEHRIKQSTQEIQKSLDIAKAKEDADQKLGQFAINAMMKTSAKDKLSTPRKQFLAQAVVRVVNEIFTTDDSRRAFITVVAIESGFMRFAQSPTGPKGLTQVAKGTFLEATKYCGLTDVNDDDVWDVDINLYAGACYFKRMLDSNQNDPYMAILSYNQGPNSDAAKTYSKYGSTDNLEALKYIAKFTFLKRVITDIKEAPVVTVPTLTSATKATELVKKSSKKGTK